MSGDHAPAVDASVIATLYQRRFHSFVGGAYAVLGEPKAARDAVQEAFARALRDRRRFRAEGTLEAWLWRIVVNVARDAARRTRFAGLSSEELAELAALGPEPTRAGDLRAELSALPERQRLAVFLHYYADLPYDEVARLLEVAPGAIAASLNAARKTLRHRIEEAYE
ncbi:MAG TPA: sigma-70 family RNA polymerase sigma factor [Gaiellaceae bacterium]|nr:sigma-70 family RNA polymerase sigma factor [Gaiellaceae bacterium]